MYIKIKKEEST